MGYKEITRVKLYGLGRATSDLIHEAIFLEVLAVNLPEELYTEESTIERIKELTKKVKEEVEIFKEYNRGVEESEKQIAESEREVAEGIKEEGDIWIYLEKEKRRNQR